MYPNCSPLSVGEMRRITGDGEVWLERSIDCVERWAREALLDGTMSPSGSMLVKEQSLVRCKAKCSVHRDGEYDGAENTHCCIL